MKPTMRRLSTRVVSIVVSIGLVLSASRAQEVLAAVNPPRAATLAVMAVKARREDARGVVAGIEHAVPVGLVEPAPWAMQPMETTTPTASPEATGTVTSTVTPSVDVVPTDNTSATPAPSETLSPTETATATSTPEATASNTVTTTPTPSETASPTASATITATEPTLRPIGPDDQVLLPVGPDAGGTQGDSQVALVDLIPTGVPLVESAPAQSLRGSPVGVPETVTLPGGKAAAIVLSGRMLVLVEDKAFEAGSTLTVNPVSMRALPAGQLLELDVSQVEATPDGSVAGAEQMAPTEAVSSTETFAEATWAGGGEVIRFEITAVGPDGKTPLTRFDDAVTIFFDLRGSGLLYPIDSYTFYFHDPAKPDEPVAIPALVVDQAGLIGFTTRHFSQYSLSSANGPWRMSWNPPAVSEFSGAATYDFPIEVPPGVNGLQPNLSINYSSRSVDGNDYADMDQGILGLGWSMSNIAIIRDGVRPGWQWNNLRAKYWDAYSLVLNGSGHEMIRTNNNVLRLTGNGSAWTQILRQQGVSRETEIQSASVRFKPAGAIAGPGYVVGLTTADGRRFALYGRNDVFVAQYRTTGSGAYSETCDLGTSFANTWYVATFTVNPGGVLTVEVYSEPNPHLRKTCSLNMGGAANDEWLFSAWAYGTNLYLDDYTDTRLAREGVEDARTEEFHDQPSTTYWGWSGAVAVVDDPTSRRYQVMNDPSVFAIQVYQPGSTSGVMNGDHIYWVVKTGDGTTHVLGYEENAEDAQSIGDTQIDNYDGMFTGDLAYRTGVRWNVSWSADVHGNRVTYTYSAHSRSAGFAPPPYPECQGASCYIQNLTTEMNRLDGVYYNYVPGSNTARTSITFTPYTEPDGSGARRVSEIVMTHGGQVMRRVAFTLDKRNFNHPNPCIPTWTYTLNTITVKDWLGNALPTTTFTYADKNTGGCSTWSYLEQVTNGYGASVKFLYTDLGRKSLVVNERQVIASPGGPMARTTYTYLNGCWDQWDNNNLPAGGVGCPASFPYGGYTDRRGGLVGFDQTTAINYAYDGVTVLNRTVSKFWRRADWAPAGFSAIPISNDSWKHLVIGFPAQVIQQDAAGNEIARQDTYYGVITAVWAYFLPVIDQYSRTTIGASFISHSNVAHYDTAWQGGDQYGNATRTWDYNESNASVYRSTLSGFYPNPATWIVSKPGFLNRYSGAVNVNAGGATSTESVWLTYDGRPSFDSLIGGRGNLTGQRINTNGSGLQDTVFGYDSFGNQTTVTTFTNYGSQYAYANGGPRTTITGFDSTYRIYPVSVTNPLGQTTWGGWYVPTSVLTYLDSPNGVSSRINYEYDTFGRLTKIIKPGDSSALPTVSYYYDQWQVANGYPFRIQTDTREVSGQGGTVTSQEFFDGLGRTILSTGEYEGNTSAVYTVYDALGRARQTSVPQRLTGVGAAHYYVNPPAGTFWTTTTYDAAGRVTRVDQPDGDYTSNAYWIGTALGIKYLVTAAYDELGERTLSYADVFGRVSLVQQNSGNGSPATPHQWYSDTFYYYDTHDRLASINNMGESTTITYNYAGQKISMSDPDMGTWSYTYTPGTGTLQTQTDAKGQVLWFGYDALDRMTEKRVSAWNGTVLALYGYGTTAPNIGYRTSLYDSTASVNGDLGQSGAWTYDTRGRVQTETRTLYGRSYQFDYAYDAMDRVTSTTYPSGEVVTQAYTSTGALASLTSTTYSANIASGISYDEAGRMRTLSYGNGLTTRQDYYAWNARVPNGGISYGQGGGLQRLITWGSSGNYQNFVYDYYSDGNIWTLTDSGHGGNNLQKQQFEYDSFGRLTSAWVHPDSPNMLGNYAHAFAYSPTGNLTSRSDLVGGATILYAGVAVGCPAGGQSTPVHGARYVNNNSANWRWCYDANGNMVQRVENGQVYNQVWDIENRLTQIDFLYNNNTESLPTTFFYNGDGNRVREVRPNGSWSVYVKPDFQVDCDMPPQPTLTGPGATVVAGMQNITWTNVVGESGYWVDITVDGGTNRSVIGPDITSLAYNFIAGKVYTITMWAVSACGARSLESNWLTVTATNNTAATQTAVAAQQTQDAQQTQAAQQTQNAAGTQTQVAVLSRTPTRTNTPTGPTHTPTRTPTRTNTPTRTPTRTNTPTGPTNTPTRTPTRTNTPTGGAGTCPVLDTFNRANGAIGGNWGGATSSFQIASNQLDVTNGGDAGPLLWSPTSFGATQQACVKFAAIDANADDIALVLKAQSNTGLGNGLMEVLYDPTPGVIRVWTYDPTNTWVKRGADLSASFAVGDTLRVIARSNGQVEIYKNTTLLGTRDASAWTYSSQGGYIGLWSLNGPNTFFDDFGGGTYTGASVADALADRPEPGADRASVRPEPLTSSPYPSREEMAAMQAAAAAATADGGLGTVDAEQARLQAEAQALVARTDAWLAEYQRATSPIAPARPSGCKPLCDLLVAPLGHTPVSPQPGERFRTYYNAGARPVAVRTIANVPGVPVHEVQYLHPDHLGSIGQITSQTGAWVQDVYFHPYGGIRWSQSGGNAISPTSSTRRTYTGQYDIGFWAGAIQHYNARQYDYVLGRFLQPDSMVPGVYEVQDLDRFAYVRNNPIRYSDSTGHCIDPLSGTACLIILGVGTVAVVATVALVMYYSSPAASEGLQTVPRLVDGAVLTASDAVGPTPFIVAGILFLETAKIAEDAQSSFEAATNSISALLAKKRDIRDFEHILDQLGMVDRAIRRRLHDEISREGLSLEEIRRIAEDLLKQIADNKRDDGADENEPDDEEPNDE